MVKVSNKTLVNIFISSFFIYSCSFNESISNTWLSKSVFINIPRKDRVDILDMDTNRIVNSLKTGKNPTDITVSNDNKLLLISNYDSNSISIYSNAFLLDLYGDSEKFYLGTIENISKPVGITFNPSENINEAYVISEGDKKLIILDTKDKNSLPKVINNYSLSEHSPRKIDVSSDGKTLYITDNKKRNIIVLKKSNNEYVKSEIELDINQNEQIKSKIDFALDDIMVDHKKTITDSKNNKIQVGTNRLFIANSLEDNIIVINDNKIETKISLKDEEFSQTKITPRNMTIYRNLEKGIEKLYVTGYDASVVSVIDLKNLKFIKNIKLSNSGNSRDSYNPIDVSVGRLATLEDIIYVSCSSGSTIALISPITDEKKRSLNTTICCGFYEPSGEMVSIF